MDQWFSTPFPVAGVQPEVKPRKSKVLVMPDAHVDGIDVGKSAEYE